MGQDCARPAIASDFFQKSLAQGLYPINQQSQIKDDPRPADTFSSSSCPNPQADYG
jgi:hypothetical protein